MIYIDVNKSLREFELRVKLEIEEGSFVSIRGDNGSAKTTLLRVISGLEKSKGTITFNGEIWQDDSRSIAVQKREIGFVFQDYALFENMSVKEQLLYVLRDKTLMEHLLDISGLRGMEDLYPKELSGGQKQRVALCRALMRRPKLLLLDEPLSALDPILRSDMQKRIKDIHSEFNLTTIMVSHDLNEIYRLADRFIKLHRGKVVEDKLKDELFYDAKDSIKAEVLAIDSSYVTLLISDEIIKLSSSKLGSLPDIGDIIDLKL